MPLENCIYIRSYQWNVPADLELMGNQHQHRNIPETLGKLRMFERTFLLDIKKIQLVENISRCTSSKYRGNQEQNKVTTNCVM